METNKNIFGKGPESWQICPEGSFMPTEPGQYSTLPPSQSDELARIVSVIREAVAPEQILQFGSQAGATPFGDIPSYDLLVLTAANDWSRLYELFKLKIPPRSRRVPQINFYLLTSADISGRMSAFYRFVRSEGRVLYGRGKLKEKACDYERLYVAAYDRYGLYMGQAEGFLEAAQRSAGSVRWREAGFHTAYGAEQMLHALYAAYHGADPGLRSLPELFARLRTLSAELWVLLDPERSGASRMLGRLEGFRRVAPYDPGCRADGKEIGEYLGRVREMGEIVKKLCGARLGLYKGRIPENR